MHLFLIPDGNRRYAQLASKTYDYGHIQGAEKIKQFMQWCKDDTTVTELSIYVLSSDNITKRNAHEVIYLTELCCKELRKLLKPNKDTENVYINIIKTSVNDNTSKELNKLSKEVAKTAVGLIEHNSRYKNNRKLTLNLLIDYSAKQEILNAINKDWLTWNWTDLQKELCIRTDVDLVVRTGGEHRFSGGLLIQSMYAEIYFSDIMFPEFTKSDFDKVIEWYNKRARRFGK